MIYDVVIAGAGPVGLFLACELRLAGCSVLLLEQADDSRAPLKGLPFGMRGLSSPTVEAFYRRGMLAELQAIQLTKAPGKPTPAGAHWMAQDRRPGGHFAGIQFFHDAIDASKWRWRLPTPAPLNLAVDMQSLEGVLAAQAERMGAQIRRGLGVEAVDASDDGVDVHAGGQTFRGRWLVGCDGGRSTVRKAGGFDFAGSDPEFTGYSVEAEIADPEKLQAGRHYTATGMYTFSPPGTIAMVEFDGGAFHRSQAVTLDHAQSVLRRVAGTDVTLTTMRMAATWTDRAFQAATYRRGRLLLAGDAAHIHSPLGGQGLNLGLGDAMNLGWKLAAVLKGAAPDGLLDSYAAERRPVGEQVLDWSRAQVALMRPSPSSRALEAIIRDLIDTRDGATYFAERVWGVSLKYDLGGEHPLTGRSAPDFEFADGTRVGDLMAGGKGLLLDFSPDASLRSLAEPWRGRLDHVAGAAKDRLGLSAVLVRPDGFVAWACDADPDPAEAARAVSRWFA